MERKEGVGVEKPITKNTTAVFVVYILYIYHDGFRQQKKPFYYDYSITVTFTIPIVKSTTAVIVVLYLYHISLYIYTTVVKRFFSVAKTIVVCVIVVNIFTCGKSIYA